MLRIGFVSSYIPRECGIATFTEDVVRNIDALNVFEPSVIIGINDLGSTYNYGKEVVMQIDATDERTYSQVADRINDSCQDGAGDFLSLLSIG